MRKYSEEVYHVGSRKNAPYRNLDERRRFGTDIGVASPEIHGGSFGHCPRPQEVGSDDEAVDIDDTEWWTKMRKRTLAGFRLKAGLTQKQLAELPGIRQTVISEYENGRRPFTMAAALKLAPPLSASPETLLS